MRLQKHFHTNVMEEIVKMAHYITDPCELSCEIGWWIVGKHNIGGTHASKMKGRNIIQKNVFTVSWTSVTFSN